MRKWSLSFVAAVAVLTAVVAVASGWGFWATVAYPVFMGVVGFFLFEILVGATRDVFVPMWRDRHLRGYGFATRDDRAFLSIFHEQLRAGLVPGSELDRAVCLAGSEVGFENQSMHLIDMGQAARYISASPVASKFSVDELASVFREMADCEFDEENLVRLLTEQDDAAVIARYIGATKDIDVALEAIDAGIAPEYAGALR